VQANYSWEKPLSARSFADWRRRLPEKEDSVTSIRDLENRKIYRVQTRTTAGILRVASLTLQADTYHPTKADFEFQGEQPMELSERADVPENGLQEVRTVPPAPVRAMETPATPEDELRVFTALDAMGAEADEPIDVKLDTAQNTVLVTGMGIPAPRRKQIETILAGLPHTTVRFSVGQQPKDEAGSVNAATNDAIADESLAFRQRLQDRYGGARQLQAATDKALDASNGLFARSHLLFLLAREFPPGVESGLTANGGTSLLSLRQRHVGAMDYALRQLKEEVSPLLTEAAARGEATKSGNWQSGAEDLFAATRNVDRLVSRLLAGQYTEQEGNTMLQQLPSDLSNVEALVRAESATNSR
jgi:hypothetical protein